MVYPASMIPRRTDAKLVRAALKRSRCTTSQGPTDEQRESWGPPAPLNLGTPRTILAPLIQPMPPRPRKLRQMVQGPRADPVDFCKKRRILLGLPVLPGILAPAHRQHGDNGGKRPMRKLAELTDSPALPALIDRLREAGIDAGVTRNRVSPRSTSAGL